MLLIYRQLPSRSFSTSLRALTVVSSPDVASRRRKTPPKRPSISLDSPRTWNRPLKKGVVPAYDLALATLNKDSLILKAEARQMRIDIEKKEANYQHLKSKLKKLQSNEETETAASEEERNSLIEKLRILDEELEKMLEKANIVQIQSEVNLPNVRWKVNNAMGNFSFR